MRKKHKPVAMFDLFVRGKRTLLGVEVEGTGAADEVEAARKQLMTAFPGLPRPGWVGIYDRCLKLCPILVLLVFGTSCHHTVRAGLVMNVPPACVKKVTMRGCDLSSPPQCSTITVEYSRNCEQVVRP